MKTFYCLLLALVLGGITARANNVQISNVTILNNGPGNIQVQFDLSWDNSWRTNIGPANYDGVWVFFKYKDATGLWRHMTMTGNNNVIPIGFDVYQTNDFLKIGAMLYREPTNMGTGSVTLSGVKLGVINTLPYNIDVRGIALEMVYIPPQQFRAFFGDGDGATESTNAFHYVDNTATNGSVVPMIVDVNSFDDAELDISGFASGGIYVYSNDTIQTSTGGLGSLDPFPTMKATWCMKYEITQAAYRDFLNTLSYDQQVARTTNAPSSSAGTGAFGTTGTNRNYIEIRTAGTNNTVPAVYGCDASSNNVYDEASDGEWVAANFLNWPDVAAFLDWSGLAPMSEFQFERICRGVTSAEAQPAILGEYAWGSTTLFGSSYSLSNGASAGEVPSNPSASVGNALYSTTVGTIGGPIRAGAFATSGSSRVVSGASFYGVMEMSGNVEEYVITVGNNAGRSVRFIPNGNGTISTSGNAQLSVGGAGFWPGMEGNNSSSVANTCTGTCEVTAAAGIVTKGGSYQNASSELRIADRSYATPSATRLARGGGRGVLNIR